MSRLIPGARPDAEPNALLFVDFDLEFIPSTERVKGRIPCGPPATLRAMTSIFWFCSLAFISIACSAHSRPFTVSANLRAIAFDRLMVAPRPARLVAAALGAADLTAGTPVVDVRAFGASGSNAIGIASGTVGSTTVHLVLAGDWKNGEGIVLYGAGPRASLAAPSMPTLIHDVTPGSHLGATSRHMYAIASCDQYGGCSAASPVVVATVPTAPTAFDRADVFWTGTDAPYYALYKDGALAGWVDGTSANGLSCQSNKCWWSDRGQPATNIPDVVPALAPTSAQADWLSATVSGGGGTTTLVLSRPISAAVIGAVLAHDDSGALTAAIAAAPPEGVVRLPGTIQIYRQVNVASTLTLTGNRLSIYPLARYGLDAVSGTETVTVSDLVVARTPMQSDNGNAACLLVGPGAGLIVSRVHFEGCATGIDGYPKRLLVTRCWFDHIGLPASITLSREGAAIATRSNAAGNGPVTVVGNRIDGGSDNGILLLDQERADVMHNIIKDANAPNRFQPLAATIVAATTDGVTQFVAHPEIFSRTTLAVFYHKGTFESQCLVESVNLSSASFTCYGGDVNVTAGDIVEMRHAGGYGISAYYSKTVPQNINIVGNTVTRSDGFGIYDQTTAATMIASNVLSDVLRDGPMDNSLSWAAITNTGSNNSSIDSNHVSTVGSRLATLYPGQSAELAIARDAAVGIFLFNCSACSVIRNSVFGTGVGNGIRYIASRDQSNISVVGNRITASAADGIFMSSEGAATLSDVNVANNFVARAAGNEGIGLYTDANGLRISGNVIDEGANGALSVAPAVMAVAVTITGNTFHGNGRSGSRHVAVVLGNIRDLTFTGNRGDHPAADSCTKIGMITGAKKIRNSWRGCTTVGTGGGIGTTLNGEPFFPSRPKRANLLGLGKGVATDARCRIPAVSTPALTAWLEP